MGVLLTANHGVSVSKLGSLGHIPLWLLLPLLPHINFDFLSATVGHGKDSSLLLLEPPVISESLQGVNIPSSPLLHWTHDELVEGAANLCPKAFLPTSNPLIRAISLCSLCLLTTQTNRVMETEIPQASPSLVIVEFAIFYPSFKPLCWRLCWCSREVLGRGGGGWGQERHCLKTSTSHSSSTSDCQTAVHKVRNNKQRKLQT